MFLTVFIIIIIVDTALTNLFPETIIGIFSYYIDTDDDGYSNCC